MTGLEKYVGTKQTVLGIDWLNFGSSALKTAGGAFGGGSGKSDATAAQMQLQAAQMQAAQAQQSASNWKLIGVLGVIGLIVGFLVLRKKK